MAYLLVTFPIFLLLSISFLSSVSNGSPLVASSSLDLEGAENDRQAKNFQFAKMILQGFLNKPCFTADTVPSAWSVAMQSNALAVRLAGTPKPQFSRIKMTKNTIRELVKSRCPQYPRLPPALLSDNESMKYVPSVDMMWVLLNLQLFMGNKIKIFSPPTGFIPETVLGTGGVQLVCGGAAADKQFDFFTYVDGQKSQVDKGLVAMVNGHMNTDMAMGSVFLREVVHSGAFWLQSDRVHIDISTTEMMFVEALTRAKDNPAFLQLQTDSFHQLEATMLVRNEFGSVFVINTGSNTVLVLRRDAQTRMKRAIHFSTRSGSSPLRSDSPTPTPDVYTAALQADDLILILSEGITKYLYNGILFNLSSRFISPHESKLINRAENFIRKKGEEPPWALPYYQQRIEDMVYNNDFQKFQYASHPKKIAEILVETAFYYEREVPAVPLPSDLESILYGPPLSKPVGKSQTSAVACWVSKSDDAEGVKSLWSNQAPFISTNPHVSPV